MAFLGLKTRDAGLGGGSTVDLLVKALTGDPEREMALARGRADLDLNAYRQRQMEAAAAQAQAEADTTAWELNQRTTNLPAIERFYAGLVDEPVPVTTPGALPAPAPGLPDPVSVAEPAPLPEYALPPVGADARSLLFQADQRPVIRAAAEPVSVDHPFAERPGELLPNEDTVQLPQPDVLPGEVVPPSPEDWAAYRREVDAAKARAGLIVGGGGNAAQMGQGLGIGEGIVKTGSDDPVVRQQGNVLYTGTNPPAAGGGETANQLRSQIMGDESYIAASGISANYQNAFNAASQDDRTSDFDLVTAVAKLVDPTGVVRGEDVNMIVANQPGMDLFKSYLETWKSDPNARLGPEIRKDLMRLAHSRASNAMTAYEHRLNEFRDIATRAKIDPRDVNLTFDEIVPWDPDQNKPGARLTPAQVRGDEPVIRPDGSEDSSRMSAEQWDRWQKAHPADED